MYVCLLHKFQYHGSSPHRLDFDGPLQRRRAMAFYTRAASDSMCSIRVHEHRGEGAVSSVLVNSKDPHSVQLRQFGDENGQQGHGVDHKMGLIVFGVEAGEDV